MASPVTGEPKPSPPNALLLFLGVVVIAVVAYGHPTLDYLPFSPTAPKDVWNALTALFLLALTFERALEVFAATFREPGAIVIRNALARIEEKIGVTPKDQIGPASQEEARLAELSSEKQAMRTNLAAYASETGVVTMGIALVGGILVSAIGVRVLGSLVETLPPEGTFQFGAFVTLDVAVTGGLIAGGSKGIHALTQAIGDRLDEIRKQKT